MRTVLCIKPKLSKRIYVLMSVFQIYLWTFGAFLEIMVNMELKFWGT